jgi:pimeloyl-ACP methyl ester carboxylesterase
MIIFGLLLQTSTKWSKRLVRGFSVFIALLVLLVAVAAGYDSYAGAGLRTKYPPPGQFIQISEARMHYLCQGSGEPTLVLEAGNNDGVLGWSQVMPALARRNRVCAFDRLGQDWSDPASYPRTFSTPVDELHTALESLGIERPVVVGHSLGGALVQIYAAKYEVAGVVLVDGLSSDIVDPVVARLGGYQSLRWLAQLGLLRPIGNLAADADYPPEIREQMIALRSQSAALIRAVNYQAVAAQTAGDELRAAEAKLDVPILIIAAGQNELPEDFTGALIALSERQPNSTVVLVPGASHYVQADHPQAVIEAIENWLPAVR